MEKTTKQFGLSSNVVLTLKWLLTLLVILFVYSQVEDDFQAFRLSELDFSGGLFAVSFLLFILYLLSSSFIWLFLTRRCGVALGVLETVSIWSYSVLGKYVPGKALVWLIRLYYYKERKPGESIVGLFACFVLEYFGGLAAGILLVTLTYSIGGYVAPFMWWEVPAVLLLLGALLLIHPSTLAFLGSRLSTMLSLAGLDENVELRDSFRVLALYFLNWLILGLSMFVLVLAFFPGVQLSQFWYVASSYVAAGIVGFLALFAPSGLGVREGIYILTLSNLMPVEYATVVAIAARLVSTFGEVSFAALPWLMNRSLRTADIWKQLEPENDQQP